LRELENVIERALITAKDSVIQPVDIAIERRELSAELSAQMAEEMAAKEASRNWTPGQTLNDIERNVILEALKHHHGNRTHTAKALGISIRTLRNKLADYRLLGINA
jgi:DNA-binding NtrC family response regulator